MGSTLKTLWHFARYRHTCDHPGRMLATALAKRYGIDVPNSGLSYATFEDGTEGWVYFDTEAEEFRLINDDFNGE